MRSETDRIRNWAEKNKPKDFIQIKNKYTYDFQQCETI